MGACAHKMDEVCQELVQHPEFNRLNDKDESGRTALHIAAIHGLGDVARCILQMPTFEEHNAKDNNTGQTALLWAARVGSKEAVKAIIDDSKCDILAKDNNGQDARALANQTANASVMNLVTTKL